MFIFQTLLHSHGVQGELSLENIICSKDLIKFCFFQCTVSGLRMVLNFLCH